MQKSSLLSTAVVAVVVSSMTFWGWQSVQPEPTIYQMQAASPAASPVLYTKGTSGDYSPLDFTEVSAQVTDAVVHIKSSGSRAAARSGGSPFEEFFRGSPWGDILPQQAPQSQSPQGMRPMGSGSGVIISSEGYIVTNNHVVTKAEQLEVVLNDNRVYSAEVVGTDPTTDLALLKIDASDLKYLSFGDSDGVKTGQWVLAVGNPYDLTSTVTAGIVSATGRNINILQEQYAIESFIQTDAAINPGNSGGALVNLAGDLIGINTAISSPTGSYSGYGFAVPANLVAKVITDLREYGNVQRGVLGVLIRNVDGNLATEKNLDLTYGVYVDSLMDNSAAKIAGLLSGDVIVSVDGRETPSSPILQEAIANKRPGDKVNVVVYRDGRERSIEVELRNRNGTTKLVKQEDLAIVDLLGAELVPVDDALAQRLDIKGGVVVQAVKSGKLSRETTMRDGFIITRVDGDAIYSIDDLEKKLKRKKGGVMLEGRYPADPRPYYYAFGM